MSPETRQSLGWYLGVILLAGQFLARIALNIPFDYIFLFITGALVLVPIFGPSFFLAFVKALRGGRGSDGEDRRGSPRDRR